MFIHVRTQGGNAEQVEINKLPDACPICHHAIEPIDQKLAHFRKTAELRIELLFRCPREKCQSFFVARYFMWMNVFALRNCVPLSPIENEFDESIKIISPDFCAIADQAMKAKREGWKLIAGPGYRKALEFLVKDYLCKLLPNDAKQIKSSHLGVCIAAYVTNERVKATAARAAWLGNDETHYVRKWEDKDLDDLKKLIALTVHWIQMEEMTESVIKEMPEGKK
jgi:hypothetical protein